MDFVFEGGPQLLGGAAVTEEFLFEHMGEETVGLPKWIAVVGTLVCVGIGAALVFDLPLHVLKVLVFAWAVVMSFLNVAVHMWVGDGHIQRAQESRRIEARRIESAERPWDV